VALSLACLAPGLLMFSMNNILGRAFYALDDIKTPMKISILCLGLNLVFAIWLVQPYRAAGLGVANTLSATLNLALLVYALRRKLSRLGLSGVVNTLLVLVPDAILAGVVAALLAWLLGETAWPHYVGTQAWDSIRARWYRCAGLLVGGALAESARRQGSNRFGFAKVSTGLILGWPRLLPPRGSLPAHPVAGWWHSGGTLEALRGRSHEVTLSLCGCGICGATAVFTASPRASCSAYSLLIEYCCPVIGPDW
jgi:hypothetical protein